jgi:hypothetical protein
MIHEVQAKHESQEKGEVQHRQERERSRRSVDCFDSILEHEHLDKPRKSFDKLVGFAHQFMR